MKDTDEFNKDYAAEQLRRSRHPLRKIIKRFYLDNIVRDVRGPTIDFGCGAGQLLSRLPSGSLGLEVNPHLVAALRRVGLNVVEYEHDVDQLSLRDISAGTYRTFVMSHVLEHFSDAAGNLRKLLASCRRIGIERVILVVPGAKGFRSDPTHKTFVDRRYVDHHELRSCEGYAVTHTSYFPLNIEQMGQHLTFHEYKVIYDRAG